MQLRFTKAQKKVPDQGTLFFELSRVTMPPDTA